LAERVHTIRARLDDVEDHWRQIQRPQRHPALPAPAPAAVATAITIVEVRAGLRPPHQLERLSHYTLWPAWAHLAQPQPHGPTPIIPRPVAVTVREVAPGLVDATVVIDFQGRPHALGLRLDGAPGFWQLLELDYPTQLAAPDPPPPDGPRLGAARHAREDLTFDPRHRPGQRESLSDASSRPLPGDPRKAVAEPDLGNSLGIELE
jgi:hypothetical protein